MSSKEDLSASASAKRPSFAARFTDFLSSVKFGIILLILLIAVSMTGMLVTQYNVTGFEAYIAEMSEFRRNLYGTLGLFDIYGTWYFNALLALLSLNIILASIEQFPRTRKLVARPNLEPTPNWLISQKPSGVIELAGTPDEVARTVSNTCRKIGWRRTLVSEKGDGRFVFAESGAWNRFGAYAVHVALLTILAGGFVTSQLSYSGQLPITVGETAAQINELVFRDDRSSIRYRRLPFAVTCLDLEQKLINPKGPLESANSIDWLTHLEISDDSGRHRAVIKLNQPFDYRGFRIFHSTFLSIAKARSVRIQATTAEGSVENHTIERNGTVSLANGTALRFVDFRANLSLTRDASNENSVGYENPAAIIEATLPDGTRRTVFAFRDNQSGDRTNLSSFGGSSLRLLDFERVSDRHVLIVRRDPGSPIVYTGFAMLIASLTAVFLFSHQRVWCAIERLPNGKCRLNIAGNTNRNQASFERRFARLFDSLLEA